MTYYIKKGTRVTVRRPGARPDDRFIYETKQDLKFLQPVKSDRDSFLFEFEGWSIRVAKNRIETIAAA